MIYSETKQSLKKVQLTKYSNSTTRILNIYLDRTCELNIFVYECDLEKELFKTNICSCILSGVIVFIIEKCSDQNEAKHLKKILFL